MNITQTRLLSGTFYKLDFSQAQNLQLPLLSHEGIKTLIKDGGHVASQQLLLHNANEGLSGRGI